MDGKIDPHLPVHPEERVYLRKPWKQTLEDVCQWRQERIKAGDDRWPGTVTEDKRERMLGKWLANQRSYRKMMDANPQNRKGLKGMCPERVRLLDARLPGWMGSEPNARVVVHRFRKGGSVCEVVVAGDDQVCGGDEAVNSNAVARRREGDYESGRDGDGRLDGEDVEGGAEQGEATMVIQPVWHLRATWGQSLERVRLWREKHPDRWPSHQDEHGDVEEAKLYRWLIEQRRYKRNLDAGKTEKLGGMNQERLELLNDVLGEDWVVSSRMDASNKIRSASKKKKKEPSAGKKRSRDDVPKNAGARRGEGSSGLNYMASLASHEMDAMRHAQHQQALHEQAMLEQALHEQTLHQQVLQAAQLVGQRHHGYADPQRLRQGHIPHGHYMHGYTRYDGRQYHSTQQHIQQLAHSRGIQHVQAYAQAHPLPQMPSGAPPEVQQAGGEGLAQLEVGHPDLYAGDPDLFPAS